MPACARREIIDEEEVGIYHCYSRVVRRAFLCGQDHYSGDDFGHRKDWIKQRLKELVAIYAIDLCDFATMDNHMHLVLRNRPDIARQWTDLQVARSVLRLYPPRRDRQGKPARPSQQEVSRLRNDKPKIRAWRKRLSSISWFMKCLKEPIAKRANAEDEVTGHFWEQRFHSVRLLDDAAVLMCSLYVDLNPIRGGLIKRLEEGDLSSVAERIHRWQSLAQNGPHRGQRAWDLIERPGLVEPAPDWLLPISEQSRPVEPQRLAAALGAQRTGRRVRTRRDSTGRSAEGRQRASHTGFLPLTLGQYLKLLDWVGRQVREPQQGAIPESVAPIVERLGLEPGALVDCVQNFGSYFRRFCGSPERVQQAQRRAGRRRANGMARWQGVYRGDTP